MTPVHQATSRAPSTYHGFLSMTTCTCSAMQVPTYLLDTSDRLTTRAIAATHSSSGKAHVQVWQKLPSKFLLQIIPEKKLQLRDLVLYFKMILHDRFLGSNIDLVLKPVYTKDSFILERKRTRKWHRLQTIALFQQFILKRCLSSKRSKKKSLSL